MHVILHHCSRTLFTAFSYLNINRHFEIKIAISLSYHSHNHNNLKFRDLYMISYIITKTIIKRY